MPHKRTPRGCVRHYVTSHGYRDRELKELICVTSKAELNKMLRENFDFTDSELIEFELGEVLTDTLGRGSLQKVEKKCRYPDCPREATGEFRGIPLCSGHLEMARFYIV